MTLSAACLDARVRDAADGRNSHCINSVKFALTFARSNNVLVVSVIGTIYLSISCTLRNSSANRFSINRAVESSARRVVAISVPKRGKPRQWPKRTIVASISEQRALSACTTIRVWTDSPREVRRGELRRATQIKTGTFITWTCGCRLTDVLIEHASRKCTWLICNLTLLAVY